MGTEHGACVVGQGILNGWNTLVLENDQVKVTVLPEYGAWIQSIYFKPSGEELLWQHPRGVPRKDDPPVVPNALNAYAARSLGAWPELFPHGSVPTEVGGVFLPMHGEVFLRSWTVQVLKAAGDDVAVRLTVDCHLMPLRLERVMKVVQGQAGVILEETVTNYAGVPVDFMWGHHPIFGKPLLSEHSRIYAPTRQSRDDALNPGGWPLREGRDWAACPAEGAGLSEMFYLDPMDEGWCALVNPVAKLGVALQWDTAVFPLMWICRQVNGAKGYPYFGRAYFVALEPFSSLPGARQAGGRLLRLEGGRQMSTALSLTAFQDQPPAFCTIT